MSMLLILAGLPGSGKTTLSRALARHYRATHLRIDTVEHGLKTLCQMAVQGEGYRLSYLLAADNLRVGNDVIADCCNPWELTRDEWEEVARGEGAPFMHVEITCSDREEHRRRVEERVSDLEGFGLPDWQAVVERDYHPFARPVLRIDTAHRSEAACLEELIREIDTARAHAAKQRP